MQVGDTVTVVPQMLDFNLRNKTAEAPQPMTGTVIYIHPKGRFYVVEFAFRFGYTVREAFDSRPKYRDRPMSGARFAYRRRVK